MTEEELPKKEFCQTLNPKTRKFLEKWYDAPIQEILRNLAVSDMRQKEAV